MCSHIMVLHVSHIPLHSVHLMLLALHILLYNFRTRLHANQSLSYVSDAAHSLNYVSDGLVWFHTFLHIPNDTIFICSYVVLDVSERFAYILQHFQISYVFVRVAYAFICISYDVIYLHTFIFFILHTLIEPSRGQNIQCLFHG